MVNVVNEDDIINNYFLPKLYCNIPFIPKLIATVGSMRNAVQQMIDCNNTFVGLYA